MAARLLNPADAPLVLEEWDAHSHRIGVATLNVEKTLNALSLPMIEILASALDRWAHDPGIAFLWLQGAGERAFAAGGDIQALHASVTRNHVAGKQVDDYAESFFEKEYRLDFMLHTYPKPILAWGHGVVMGGGLGLLTASSHRVLTERVRVAMPEITIGLFPDAGSTWLLRNMPPAWGAWMALGAVHFNQADGIASGLGNFAIPHAARADVVEALCAAHWSTSSVVNGKQLDALLAPFVVSPDRSSSQLLTHREAIERAFTPLPLDAADALTRIATLDTSIEYLRKAAAAAQHGCATTIGIVLEQMRRAPSLDLADCFRMEMVIATHCARNRDFAEGVRALLIDKDNAPRWTYADAAALPAGWVESHFAPPWAVNPLTDLG
jgi:enoyl-CoA hydratase/carnithine racemase